MPSRPIDSRAVAILLAWSLSLASTGCAHKKVQAAAPVTVAPAPPLSETERPMNTAPDTDATPPVEAEAAPPTVAGDSTTPPPVTIPSKKPAPPKPAAEQPATDVASEPPAHPPAPQISAQLSPGDQASYERKTNEDVGIAEKNLQEANGRQLSASQRDLVEKIRSFLAQSRDASKAGDWARAQNLSQKARLLSVELIGSL
jgi:hypothetical protein